MSRYHCWLCQEYRKQERELELKELRRVIKAHFPDLAKRGSSLRLGDRYDVRHRGIPPDNYFTFHLRHFVEDGKQKILNIMTDPKGTPLWVAPWMDALVEFQPSDFRPPINAEYALHVTLSKEELDAQIGDLIERYNQKIERFGRRRANLWFYSQVVRLIWPAVRLWVAKTSGLLALAEWIRRLL